MIIYSIPVGYAIDRVRGWGEPVTVRSRCVRDHGFDLVYLLGGIGNGYLRVDFGRMGGPVFGRDSDEVFGHAGVVSDEREQFILAKTGFGATRGLNGAGDFPHVGACGQSGPSPRWARSEDYAWMIHRSVSSMPS
jgi:hypothetical protein